MGAFLGSFITYVVEMVCMVCLGICGGYIGIKLRKNKTQKTQDGGTKE